MTRSAPTLAALGLCLVACGESAPNAADASLSSPDSALAELSADAGDARYALVGEEVVLDASASTGAARFEWTDGNGNTLPSSDGIARVSYAEPGRYQAVVSAFDTAGNRKSASVLISVTHPPVFQSSGSSTVIELNGGSTIAALSPDSDEMTLFSRSASDQFAVLRRQSTCDNPRTLVEWGAMLAVVCQDDDTLMLQPTAGGPSMELDLPWGSRPYGAAVLEDELFVTLGGTGQLARVSADLQTSFVEAVRDARGIASLPGGRLAVTRWRSPDSGAELVVIDPDTSMRTTVQLQVDPQAASDTEIGGVPSYLGQIAVSPTGLEAALPSLQANIAGGGFLGGEALKHDTFIRATVSFLDLAGTTVSENFERRKQFDNRGFASAAAYSSRGDFVYVAMPGNRAVARYDTLSDTQSGALAGVGLAPDGIAASSDDEFVYVTAFMSREFLVYRTESFASGDPAIASLALVSQEPLAPVLLRGKQLFYDSTDPRLSKDGYMACAHCHLDGDSDNRVWDFSDRGEGLRNTISLLGRAGTGDGPIHWSGNFDEIHDFEGDIREAFDGLGLMSDADFNSGTRSEPLGDSKAGLSAELDELAAYVTSLSTTLRSPHALSGGVLDAAAIRGKEIFDSAEAGCTSCHLGPRLTDSQWLSPGVPLLHNVGTLGAGSGQRLGAALVGIDTPSLLGLSSSWPYLHDGSASTLLEVLTTRNGGDTHGKTSHLSSAELSDLEHYLLSK